MLQIAGSGGGGSKGGDGGAASTSRTAYEEPNNLISEATASMTFIYSEGRCSGLEAGLQSIFFDGTPVQNADGSPIRAVALIDE